MNSFVGGLNLGLAPVFSGASQEALKKTGEEIAMQIVSGTLKKTGEEITKQVASEALKKTGEQILIETSKLGLAETTKQVSIEAGKGLGSKVVTQAGVQVVKDGLVQTSKTVIGGALTSAFGIAEIALSENKVKACCQVLPAVAISFIPGLGLLGTIAFTLAARTVSASVYDKLTLGPAQPSTESTVYVPTYHPGPSDPPDSSDSSDSESDDDEEKEEEKGKEKGLECKKKGGKEHTKNISKKTKDKHEKGQARKNADQKRKEERLKKKKEEADA